ncbi:hypothetical protein OG21DRAFT_1497848 [Imleria badia]|nr:hypothetical protein OG21DRAFT_1497848 [Imleria badia]
MTTLAPVFPAETVCRILRYSSPRDLVRWRAVSKWFCAITYDASIWRYLYTNSCLPRPPGPFPFQSTVYLEQALLRTERLARSWMTRPMRDVSLVELQVEQQPRGVIRLLSGRFLIGCESASRFVLHDVDANVEPHASQKQVIWEQQEQVLAWAATSIATEDGRFVMYVLLSERKLGIPRWRLLEFCFSGKSVKPCAVDTFDVPTSKFESYRVVLQKSGKSPFLHLSGCKLVFDMRTRVFYEFPKFFIALDETRHKTGTKPCFNISATPDRIVLTSTHIIALHRHFVPPFPGIVTTILQAFTVDGSSVRNGKGVLRLSHEGTSDHHFHHIALLRNSIVDPITESTNVRLLECVNYDHDLRVLWGDLTLSKPTGNDVLPITIVIHEKVEKKNAEKLQGYGTLPWDFDCSDAGLLRGYCRANFSEDPQYPSCLAKFTLDATQDECMLAVGEVLPPEWNHIKDPGHRIYGKDGKYMTNFDASGRFCLVRYSAVDDPNSNTEDRELVVVVDIE